MGKYIRILIAIVVVLSLVLWARNEAAWAAKSDQLNPSGVEQLDPSASLDQQEPCDKENWKDKDKKKCREGSVLPPDDDIEVCKRGDYSVGGIATLDVKNLRGDGCLTAHTQDPDPALGQPPAGSSILSDVLALTLPAKGGNLKICFAVPPGKQANIYSLEAGSWIAVKTKVKNGIACADVKASGSYTLIAP